MIRAAIMGLGRWGRALVTSVNDKSDDIQFVVGHTRTRTKAEEFCAGKGVRLVDDYDTILADPVIDAVVLATPRSQHVEQIKRAAAAGKQIFVEKPMTLDLASAQAAVAAAQKAGVILAVGYCRRFHPCIGEVRQRLQDGGSAMSSPWWRSTPPAAGLSSPPPMAFRPQGGAHQRNDRGGIAFAGSHDRVRRPRARRAVHHSAQWHQFVRRHHHAAGTPRKPDHRHHLVLDRHRQQFQLQHLRHARHGRGTRHRVADDALRTVSQSAPVGPVMAPPDETVEQPARHAQCRASTRSPAVSATAPFPVSLDDALHGVAIFDAAVQSAESGGIVAVAAS